MSETYRLNATLVSPQKGYVGLFIPSRLLGLRKRVRIKGTMNGKPFVATANPVSGDRHAVMVNRQMREALGLEGDEQVELQFVIDTAPAQIAIPPELQQAFKRVKGSEQAFLGMAYSHRKEYIRWIEEAKRPETRARRIEETLRRVVEGKPAP